MPGKPTKSQVINIRTYPIDRNGKTDKEIFGEIYDLFFWILSTFSFNLEEKTSKEAIAYLNAMERT